MQERKIILPGEEQENWRFDFHTHTTASDGANSPRELVGLAREAGIAFLALADHDTISGYEEAAQAGREMGLPVLPALEMDTEFPTELHILGLGVEPDHPVLLEAMEIALERRERRNQGMQERLLELEMDPRPFLQGQAGTITRMHYARALRDGGFVKDVAEAFEKYLGVGRPAYCTVERFSPKEVLSIIKRAGGISAIAHPSNLHCDVHALVSELAFEGLGGLEAYYPTATPGQISTFVSLARQHRLLVSCGSDYHGPDRPKNRLGSSWQDVPELKTTFDLFRRMM